MAESRTYAKRDERQVIAAAKSGDLRAMDRIVRHYNGLCHSVAHEYFFPGSSHEDVAQEARLGLVKAVDSFDLASLVPFERFARLCIERNVITGLKAAQRGKHGVLNDSARWGKTDAGEDIEVVDLLPSPFSVDPYRVIVAKERLAALLTGVKKLSPTERRALLGIANGLAYEQIGPYKQVDNALQRARLKLRDAA